MCFSLTPTISKIFLSGIFKVLTGIRSTHSINFFLIYFVSEAQFWIFAFFFSSVSPYTYSIIDASNPFSAIPTSPHNFQNLKFGLFQPKHEVKILKRNFASFTEFGGYIEDTEPYSCSTRNKASVIAQQLSFFESPLAIQLAGILPACQCKSISKLLRAHNVFCTADI